MPDVAWEDVDEPPSSISMTPQERMRRPEETIVRDGQRIPMARPDERIAFERWAKANNVKDPYHPDQHYDYVGAFRAGQGRQKGSEGHFTDQFKLPGHETFSNESDYARGPEGDHAGSWDGDTFIPASAKTDSSQEIAWEDPVSEPEMTKTKAADVAGFTFPGVQQVGAAINTAIDLAKHPGGNIADTYRAWIEHQDALKRKAQKDQPLTYGLASTGVNVGGAVAGAPAIAATKTIGAIANALAPTQRAAAVASQGLTDLVLGGASSATEDGTLDNAGTDALIGGAVGKALGAAGRGVAKGVGSVLKGGQNAVDDIAAWIGKKKLGKAMASKDAAAPDGLLRSERVKDLESVVGDATPSEGPAPSTEKPKVSGTREEIEAYLLGKAAKEGRARIEGVDDFSVPKDVDLAQTHRDATQEASDKFYGKDFPQGSEDNLADVHRNRVLSSKTGEEAADRLETYDAFRGRTSSNMDAELDIKLERARYWRDRLKAAEEAKAQSSGNAREQARLNDDAARAKDELRAIGIGRSAIENVGGGVSAAAGLAKGDFQGAAMAIMGKPAAKAVLRGVDIGGAAGQRLAKVASVAERLATRDDAVGRAAQWALSAEGNKAMARMAILADMPEVQEEIDR